MNMITMSLYGGFHNVDEIKVRLTEDQAKRIKAGYELSDVLTPYQDKKLSKHFCGIEDCTCGGYSHRDVKVTITDGAEVIYTND